MISNMKNETRQFNEFGFEILTDDEKKQEDVRLAIAIKRFLMRLTAMVSRQQWTKFSRAHPTQFKC